MAALLVGLSIMAVLATVAMPVWKQIAQREKEEELVFRGLQYARAIGLFQRKYANAFPPNIDVLVEQRFLRKKYKDPITNQDFVPLLQGQQGATPGSGSQTASRPGQSTAGTQTGPGVGQRGTSGAGAGAAPGISPIGTPGGGPAGGIVGVTSKSKDKSIRIYNGRTHYNEWAFVYTPQVQAPGAAGVPGGIPGRGQRGQPSTNPFAPGGGGGIPRGGPGRGGPGRGGGPGSPGEPGGPGTGRQGPGSQTPIFPPRPGR